MFRNILVTFLLFHPFKPFFSQNQTKEFWVCRCVSGWRDVTTPSLLTNLLRHLLLRPLTEPLLLFYSSTFLLLFPFIPFIPLHYSAGATKSELRRDKCPDADVSLSDGAAASLQETGSNITASPPRLLHPAAWSGLERHEEDTSHSLSLRLPHSADAATASLLMEEPEGLNKWFQDGWRGLSSSSGQRKLFHSLTAASNIHGHRDDGWRNIICSFSLIQPEATTSSLSCFPDF